MRRYQVWAGEPRGRMENLANCVVAVADGGRSGLSHQCQFKRGKGVDEYAGLLCGRHARAQALKHYLSVPPDRASSFVTYDAPSDPAGYGWHVRFKGALQSECYPTEEVAKKALADLLAGRREPKEA